MWFLQTEVERELQVAQAAQSEALDRAKLLEKECARECKRADQLQAKEAAAREEHAKAVQRVCLGL